MDKMDAAWVEYETPYHIEDLPPEQIAAIIKHAFRSGYRAALRLSPDGEASDLVEDQETCAMCGRRRFEHGGTWCFPFLPSTDRVEIGADDPLYKAFRPSAETVAAIERNEAANAQGLAAIRDMMMGHVTNWPEPKKFGTALALIDKTLHAATRLSARDGWAEGLEAALVKLYLIDPVAVACVCGELLARIREAAAIRSLAPRSGEGETPHEKA